MKKRGLSFIGTIIVSLWCVLWPSSSAYGSYAFYIGRNLTADGSVLIGGTGEEVSSHWLEIVPRRTHDEGAMIRVGVTDEAIIPGELIEIPQIRETFRYITMNYTQYRGLPPPLTNGGLNEHGVAVRDVWSPSRRELVEITPTPQRGLNYSDLARIMLERARTSREAVEILGALIDEHGYATYGGNSHLVADSNEGWVILELAGGRGLWVAERLGPDDVRVSYPGYIGEVPQNYLEHEGFMGSENLISFAVEQGWYDPESGEPFDVHRAYGLQGRDMRSPGLKFVDQRTLEDELLARRGNITVADAMALARDYRWADDEAGYGQLAHLSEGLEPDLQMLWVAPTGSITAPFIPYWIGVESVPFEYRQHRYLTRNSGSTFLHPDYASQEGTEFAGRVFKRLMYFACDHPNRFLPEVTEALTAFEARVLRDRQETEGTAAALMRAGEDQAARRYLTHYSNSRAAEGLDLGRALLGSIEARTAVIYGIREPTGDDIHAEGGAGRRTVNCRDTLEGPLPTTTATDRVEEVSDDEVDEDTVETAATDDMEEDDRSWMMYVVAGLVGLAIGWGLNSLRTRR